MRPRDDHDQDLQWLFNQVVESIGEVERLDIHMLISIQSSAGPFFANQGC